MGGGAAGTQMYIDRVLKKKTDAPDWEEFKQELGKFGTGFFVPVYNEYVWSKLQDPQNWDTVFYEAAFKGLGTGVNAVGTAAKLAAEGTPEAIFNPEINPYMKDIPLAGVPELIAINSRAYANKQGQSRNAREAEQDIIGRRSQEIDKIRKAQIYFKDSGGGTPETMQYLTPEYAGTMAGKKALEAAERDKSNQEKFHTSDPGLAQYMRGKEAEYKRYEATLQEVLIQQMKAGRLTPETAKQIWNTREYEIQKRMYNKAKEKGEI
jgi:hypothetical protein